jgi:hypothetical protein
MPPTFRCLLQWHSTFRSTNWWISCGAQTRQWRDSKGHYTGSGLCTIYYFHIVPPMWYSISTCWSHLSQWSPQATTRTEDRGRIYNGRYTRTQITPRQTHTSKRTLKPSQHYAALTYSIRSSILSQSHGHLQTTKSEDAISYHLASTSGMCLYRSDEENSKECYGNDNTTRFMEKLRELLTMWLMHHG